MSVPTKVSSVCCCLVLLLGLALDGARHGVEAGLFRDREYFNVEADGFWIKGRCFMPGRVEIPDEYNFVVLSPLDDFGCVVKNRRGEHRLRRREADVHVTLSWVIEEGRALHLQPVGAKICDDSRRCRTTREGPLPTGIPGLRPPPIVGLVAAICGQRDEPGRRGTQFEVHVGKTPAGRSGVHQVMHNVTCR